MKYKKLTNWKRHQVSANLAHYRVSVSISSGFLEGIVFSDQGNGESIEAAVARPLAEQVRPAICPLEL